MRRLSLAFLAVSVALVLAACGGTEQKVPADAIAVVGGQPIAKADYDNLLLRAEAGAKASKRPFPKPGTPAYADLKQKAVEILTQRAEYEKEAKDLGVQVTDKQIDDRLKQLKAQIFQGNEKRYQAELKKFGLSESDLREDIRSQLIADGIYKKVTADVKVTDAAVRKFYESHRQQYTQAETRDIRHILVDVKSKKLADRLYDQVKANPSLFPQLAKKYSKDPGSKNRGGKLTIVRGQTVAPFDQTAFFMRKGQISRPVKTQYGYHIIQALSAIKPAKTTPLKDVRETIRLQLLQQRKNERMTQWVKDTKKKYASDISYQVGFAPPKTTTGTTTAPNQP